MAKDSVKDMTKGSPLKQIFQFSVPLVLGTLLQQLYSVADTIIVGRYISVDALAAVGTTYSLNFLIIGFVMACSAGFGILVAQRFGAEDYNDMRRYVFNSAILAIIFSVVLSLVTVPLSRRMLSIMHTPEDILDLATIYIQIIFEGIGATFLYNLAASIMRAMGDSKHPIHFLLIGSTIHIILDLIMIIPLHMGVLGAAVSTVVSQLVAGILSVVYLLRNYSLMHFEREECKFSKSHCYYLCAIGVPMGLEYSLSAIGAVLLQTAINAMGSVAVAAVTSAEKVRQLFTLPMESVGTAMATYAGQNIGARRTDRLRQGIFSGLTIQGIYAVCAWCILFLLKTPIVSLFLDSGESEILSYAVTYLTWISPLFFFLGILMIFRHSLQGMGYSTIAIISGVMELIGRGVTGYLAVNYLGFHAITVANPAAWLLAAIYCIFMFYMTIGREERNVKLVRDGINLGVAKQGCDNS